VATEERTDNAGGRADRVDDLAEVRILHVSDRLVEVDVVQQVKELKAHSELRALPVGEVEVLHDRQVGVKEPRTKELVAALLAEASDGRGKGGSRQARGAAAGRGQYCLACATRAGAAKVIGENLRSGARGGSVVVAVKSTSSHAVVHRERKASAVVNRARNCPV